MVMLTNTGVTLHQFVDCCIDWMVNLDTFQGRSSEPSPGHFTPPPSCPTLPTRTTSTHFTRSLFLGNQAWPLLCYNSMYLSPASEANRAVANLTWRKNPYTLYMVSKNLSVCLSSVSIFLLLGTSPQTGCSISFYNITHQLKNHNLIKKSLQVWVPELLWLAPFCLFLPKKAIFEQIAT